MYNSCHNMLNTCCMCPPCYNMCECQKRYYNKVFSYSCPHTLVNGVNAPGPGGTLIADCNNSAHLVYNGAIPLSYKPYFYNGGSCPVDCIIYYTEWFSKKREVKRLKPGETWRADRVRSLIQVAIVCRPEQSDCKDCDKATNKKCMVQWTLY